MRLNQVTVAATDLAASIAFYEKLGLILIVRSDHYARFELPEGGATFSLELADGEIPRAHAPVIYFECDVDTEHARLADAGLAFETAPEDMSWLWRQAYLRDPAGNRLCLYRAGKNRRFPPWRLAAPHGVAHYHLVVLKDGTLLLVKRPAADWRALQNEFEEYQTSLGPFDFDEAMGAVEQEWPDIYSMRAATMRAFAASTAITLTL